MIESIMFVNGCWFFPEDWEYEPAEAVFSSSKQDGPCEWFE